MLNFDELLKAYGQLTITFGAFDEEVTAMAESLDRQGRDIARKRLARWTLGAKITHLEKEIEQIASSYGMADDPLTLKLRALIPEFRWITEQRNLLVHGSIRSEPIAQLNFISFGGTHLELTPELVWEVINRIRNVFPDVITVGIAFYKEWKRCAKAQQKPIRKAESARMKPAGAKR